MRIAVAVSLLSLTVAVACKGKPKHQAPPTDKLSNATNVGSGMKAAPDIALPKGDGSPPKKTTAPIDQKTLEHVASLTYQGFQLQPHGFNGPLGLMEVRQKTEDHPKIWATMTIVPCTDEKRIGACTAMTDLAAWKARGDGLKNLLLAELRAMPDTVFEVGQTQLNGTAMIYTYQLAQTKANPMGSGANPEVGSNGGPAPGHSAWSHAYVLYYNDGANQIRVVSEYKDDPLADKEAMAKAVPRPDLENVARAFMDVYTQAW